MQKHEDIEALQKAKEILESAGMRIDERTPLENRTRGRFTMPKLSHAKKMITRLLNYIALVVEDQSLLGLTKICKSAFSKLPVTLSSQPKKVVIQYDLLGDSDICNNRTIMEKLLNYITSKVKIDSSTRKIDMIELNNTGISYNGVSRLYMIFEATCKAPSAEFLKEYDDMTDYEVIKIGTKWKEWLKSVIEEEVSQVKKITDAWKNSYDRAWGKNESIAYADLPWADKQTTIAGSNGNLFKSRRLNEAMDRIFEDATEAGAKQKYEEDFTK